MQINYKTIPYLFIHFIVITTSCTTNKLPKVTSNIINKNCLSCVNCVHYIPGQYEYANNLSECALFGKKDIVTDKVKNDLAHRCREDETKCGINGKYFEEEKNIEYKKLLHFFDNNKPIFLGIFIGVFGVVVESLILKLGS